MKRYLLLIALLTFFPVGDLSKAVIANEVNSTEVVEKELDPELKVYAKAISVRISSKEENRGSGVIIGRQGSKYLVVTNYHVIRDRDNLSIQTEDGISHQGKIVENPMTANDDIALLVFESSNNYQPVRLNSVNTAREEKSIYAVGYAAETGEFTITAGNIERVISQPFAEGYQIGYSSDVLEGMSGGAIFDGSGDLVGINGIGAFPILDTAYQYEDGTTPSATEIEQFRPLSWGLSLHRLLTQLNSEIITAYGLPLPDVASLPQTELTGWLGELEATAKQITVRIDSSSKANGSGVIIAKEGNTYTVLTADHVLCEKDEGECQDNIYTILAPDGQQYTVDRSTINREEGVDLAVVRFTSNENYQVAELTNYPLTDRDAVFVAGYPKLDKNTSAPWLFSLGYGLERERGLLSVSDSSRSSDSSSLASSQGSLAGGYEMVYTSITYGGMSGGAVLDRDGRVVGIHGLAEGETALDSQTSSRKQIQLGYSLGIPINTFIGLQDRLQVDTALSIQENKPRELNTTDIQIFQAAILGAEIPQGNATAERWLERGNQLWRLGRYDEAVAAFDRAIALNPDFIHLAHYGKGLTLIDLRRYEAALESLSEATKTQPDFAPAFDNQSIALRQLNRLDEALVAIESAITLQPDSANLYNQKGIVLSDLERDREAEVVFNRAIAINPRSVYYNNRGLVYKNQGELDKAIADYNQAIAINPNDADAYNNRGNVYRKQGELDKAIADYNQAIAINPNDAYAYNNRGLVYHNQGKLDKAITDYNQAIDINSKLAPAYNNRGNVYQNQGELDKAIADYNQAIAINPKDVDAYYNRGTLYGKQGEIDKAIADYNQAIAINPKYALAYNNRGNLYSDQGELDKAIADFNQVIEIEPNDALAYNNRGNLYKSQGELDKAIADYNQAIAINPKYALAYNNRGNLYKSQGEIDKAIADYNQAIAINPKYANAYYNRGLVYRKQGELDKAIADFNQVIEIEPNDAEAYANLGVVYQQKGNFEAARTNYLKAQQLFIAQDNSADAEKIASVLQRLP